MPFNGEPSAEALRMQRQQAIQALLGAAGQEHGARRMGMGIDFSPPASRQAPEGVFDEGGAPIAAGTQFDPFSAAPFGFDNVQGELVNLETQLIKPILVTDDEQFVVVANEPDNRLVVFTQNLGSVVADIVLGQGIAAVTERPLDPNGPDNQPREIWVSVRHQTSIAVINETTWRITHLLRPPIGATSVGAREADRPGGIAFNSDGSKAYVCAGSTDSLTVFDAVNKLWMQNIPLRRPHNQMTPAMNEPYAVVSDGTSVYVVSQISGNQTAPIFAAAGPVDIVIKVTNFSGFSLPDFDILKVDTVTDTVVDHKTEVGTVLLGAALHPATGELIVPNIESHNADFIGEGAFPLGQVTTNRVTFVNPGGAPPWLIVDLESGAINPPVVMPTDAAVDAFGRVFVAGYASSNIAAISSTHAKLGVIPAQAGPRGLAVALNAGRLYCLNRAENTVSMYDISNAGTLPTTALVTVSLIDPTYDRVKTGRKIYLDPSHSGAGTTGCFSCHHDLQEDGLTWELSKYFDVGDQFTYTNQPTWKDRKGPMVTQDLRSLVDVPGYHWRGEQKDLDDFNGAFPGLLKGTELSPAQFALMKDYVFSAFYPPNPFQQMNRVFTSSAALGAGHFFTANSDGVSCEQCHAAPTGSDASITVPFLTTPASPLVLKSTQLRGMWTKNSDLANADNNNPPAFGLGSITVLPMTGTGFFHSGIVDSFDEFVNIFFPDPVGGGPGLTAQQRLEVIRLLDEYDSGLAPSTMYSELVNKATISTSLVGSYLIGQANSGQCDLVARGRLRLSGVWRSVGLKWSTAQQLFIPDTTSLGTFTWARIKNMATNNNAELLFLGVPVWSGQRIGLDRDRDGVFDGDESAAGLNPTIPDTDGDGMWDGDDPQPLNPNNTIMYTVPPTPSNIQVVFTTTNSIKVIYETDFLSPTRVEFGTTTAYGQVAGDPFPLPVFGANNTNLWKRQHTAYLRLLQDGTPYHFRVLTQGQNNQTFTTADMTTNGPIRADAFTPNLRVTSIALTASAPSPVNYTATVTVLRNDGTAEPTAVTVTGRWTHYTGNTIQSQRVQQVVTTSGVALFNTSNAVQATGDRTVFDVPMTTSFQGTPVAGVSHATLPFTWPEGVSEKEILVP